MIQLRAVILTNSSVEGNSAQSRGGGVYIGTATTTTKAAVTLTA